MKNKITKPSIKTSTLQRISFRGRNSIMKIFTIIGLLIIESNLLGQVVGKYNGTVKYSTITESDGSKYDLFYYKQIVLNADSSFLFWRTYQKQNSVCWNCIDTIFVSGNWTVTKDTIKLNSKYQIEDFVEINEFRTNDSLDYFIYNTNYNCHNTDKIIINDTISFDIHCWSILKKDISEIKSLRFEKYIGNSFLYEYKYYPKEYKPNFFTINIKSVKVDKYNKTIMNNTKLLYRDNKLIPINKNGLINVDNDYKK